MKPRIRSLSAARRAAAQRAAAAPTAAVSKACRCPAWVERGGSARRRSRRAWRCSDRRPRRHRRRLARCCCKLAEGSAVKLGENARSAGGLAERRRDRRTARHGVARRACEGAFRFTTGIFAQAAPSATSRSRVATVTAGIRGTDLWGKSDERARPRLPDRGRDRGRRHGADRRVHDGPSRCRSTSRRATGKPLPVGSWSKPQQLSEWAAETEIDARQRRARAAAAAWSVQRRRRPDKPALRSSLRRSCARRAIPRRSRPAPKCTAVRIVDALERARCRKPCAARS